MLLIILGSTLQAQVYHLGQVVDNPDGSRGVVFYVNEEGTGGWMVALHDIAVSVPWGLSDHVEGLAWVQPNQNNDYYSTVLADVDGYANTLAIREHYQNAGYSGTYAAGLVDFENGWYLPAAGQLRMLYANAIFYESALASVGEVLGLHPYWSSSVYSDDMAWYVHFGSPYPETGWAHNGGLIPTLRTETMPEFGGYLSVRAVRNLDFSPLPHIANLKTPDVICGEAPLDVELPYLFNAESYGWQIAEDMFFDNPIAYEGQTLDTTYNDWYLRLWAANDEGTTYSNVVQLSIHQPSEYQFSALSCFPYEWNGQVCDTTGIYQQVLENQWGCDSIVTLDLTIGPVAGEIQGETDVNIHNNGDFTYSIDSVPFAMGYAWTIDNQWLIDYSLDSPECTVHMGSPGQATLSVRVFTECGYVDRQIHIHHDRAGDFNIFPNPTDGDLNLHLMAMKGKVIIRVHDMLGNLVAHNEVNTEVFDSIIPYSLKGKTAGVYYFTVIYNHEVITKKVVKSSPIHVGIYY